MQRFSIKNIKSFRDSTDIELKPITIFVGKNSSGKSSLLRFPVVLSQTFGEEVSTPLLLFGRMLDYGTFDDIVYRHEKGSMEFKLGFGKEVGRFGLKRTFPRNDYFQEVYNEFKFEKCEISFEISIKQRTLYVKTMELYIDEKRICSLISQNSDKYQWEIYQLYHDMDWKPVAEVERLEWKHTRFERFMPRLDEDELIIEWCIEKNILNIEIIEDEIMYRDFFDLIRKGFIKEEYQEEAKEYYQTMLIISMCLKNIRTQLERDAQELSYIGPFRADPQRTYRESESSFIDVGVRGENTSMLLRQAAQGEKNLLENVSKWLKSAMGYELEIEEVGKGLYSLVMKKGQAIDNIMDVGYGISQVLPIVTQLYNCNFKDPSRAIYGRLRPKKNVIFEQPELHLHPAAQARLADLFVSCVGDRMEKNYINRIMIETHSEHLIRRLQVLVADPDIKFNYDQIAIYYVDKDEDGSSHVMEMKLTENGQFEKPWPSGFFDKSYELTKELLRVNNKRG